MSTDVMKALRFAKSGRTDATVQVCRTGERFVAVHGLVRIFRVGRHLLRAAHHRLLRTRAFLMWHDATCPC
jgi:hypothetical protein